jgi:hypothetical protein
MGYEMWKPLTAIAVTIAAAAGIMAAAQANAPSKEQRCESWMTTDMNARLHGQFEPPPMNACASLSDAQWMAINEHLEPLHNALIDAHR